MAEEIGLNFRQGQGIFLFSTASRSALGATQPTLQPVPGPILWENSSRGMKLTIHLLLVTRSKVMKL
jgi:hypothetical protein